MVDVTTRVVMALRRMRECYASGEINQGEVTAYVGRAQRIMRRHFFRKQQHVRTRTEAESINMGSLERLRQVRDRGGWIVAMDTGFQKEDGSPLEEFGFTWIANGRYVTRNLVDRTVLSRHPDESLRVMRHPDQVYVPGKFAETEMMPLDEIRQIAQSLYDRADVILFHGWHTDVEKLALDVSASKHIDTASCARVWTGARWVPSLEKLCERYGIASDGFHNSGNDSRYTLEAAFAMVDDPSRLTLIERNRLRRLRDDAYRRLIFWPTRRDDYHVPWREWRDLDVEQMRVKTGKLWPGGPLVARKNRTRKRTERRKERARRKVLLSGTNEAQP